MSEKPPKGRLRRLLKRGLIVFGALLLLFVGFVFSADRYRASGMADRRERLNEALAQVESNVLKGKTPAQWQAARVHGSNGWKHIAFIYSLPSETHRWRLNNDDGDPKPESVKTWDAVEELARYYEGEWEMSNPDDPDADPVHTPPPELIDQWLKQTDSLAAAYAKAAACDTIVRMPLAGESYPLEDGGIPFFDNDTQRAILERCRILQDRGRDQKALGELLACAQTNAKRTQPICQMDLAANMTAWQLCVEFTTDELLKGKLTAEQARRVATYRPDVISLLRTATESQAVWLYLAAKHADYAMQPPRLFDWITGDVPGGSGMFVNISGSDDDFDSLRARYFGPGNFTAEIALSVESANTMVKISRQATPWDPQQVPVVEKGRLTGFHPFRLFTAHEGRTGDSLKWLELELRILEKNSGPLVNQKAAVAQLIGKYPGAVFKWDGDELDLGVDPKLKVATEVAINKQPEPDAADQARLAKMKEVARHFSHQPQPDDQWAIRIVPADQLHTSDQ